ncbi:hypothetical protein Pmani_013381 [Petrolisthes manimaculis]|uniref:Uncharacterized protein n=1 Tax=Petrolisthes manimaculis TaxID=1843537 RepID=A0AAE1PVH1_9EUCA|nr:hypothetical protein Pmani_013381 [Petrolisthes manimaculis]
MRRRIKELQKEIAELESAYMDAEKDWKHTVIAAELRTTINSAFEEMMTQHNNSIIRSNQKILHDLVIEASKSRGSFNSNIIEKRHIEAAKQLRADRDTTMRRADIAATYVLINTEEYLKKIDAILEDQSKVKRVTKDTTETLKKNVNQLITTNNAATNSDKLNKLIG